MIFYIDVTISDEQVNTLVPKEVEIWPTLREVPGPKDISHSHEDGPTHHIKSFYLSHLISGQFRSFSPTLFQRHN